MPIVEYKHHINHLGKIEVPGWVMDRGYHYRDSDKTYLGWVEAEADREYLIPDTVDEKDKAACVTRALAMHASHPFINDSAGGMPGQGPAMSTSEVTTMMENWYDTITTNNT